MEVLSDFATFMTQGPAIAGLILVAPIIFLAADWRLSLSALLVQSVLVAVALSRFVQSEVVIVKIIVGVLVVPILYLTARRVEAVKAAPRPAAAGRFRGLQAGWGAGPLGLPLRFLAFLLAGLGVFRLFQSLNPTIVPADIALAACWLGGMGVIGLVLSGEPLRVAPAALTILAAFDLIYSALQQNLAITGLFGALTLLAALAFSYLSAVQGLSSPIAGPDHDEEARP
jgi:hypothetical protein